MPHLARLRTTSDFDRKYLRNGHKYPKSENNYETEFNFVLACPLSYCFRSKYPRNQFMFKLNVNSSIAATDCFTGQ